MKNKCLTALCDLEACESAVYDGRVTYLCSEHKRHTDLHNWSGVKFDKTVLITSKPFEDFLKDEHAKGYSGTDDDMSDAFDTWVTGLDNEELINFANFAMSGILGRVCFERKKLTLVEEMLIDGVTLVRNQK